jgi:replicative DNA helicase
MLTDRLPPQNIECEESLLASLICFGAKFDEIADIVSSESFYRTANKTIFQSIRNLSDKKEPVDMASVVSELRAMGELENIGGAMYIARLSDIPATSNPEYYAEKIKDAHLLRTTIEKSYKIIEACHSNMGAAETIDEAQRQILGIHVDGGERSSSFSDMSCNAVDRYEEAYRNRGQITGITTGFNMLDHYTCGFQKSNLIILAARPSMGKSALAKDFSVSAAKAGYPVGGFSLEMSKPEWLDRTVSGETRINGNKFRSGYFVDQDWDKITSAMDRINALPIHIDDDGDLHYAEIRRRARKMKKKFGCKLFFIDHLQLVSGDNPSNRNLEIGSITKAFKMMAKELECPVVLLSQLNRKLEERGDKRPVLSDLRDSGNIEQDADLVVFIYRRAVYNDWRGFQYQGYAYDKSPGYEPSEDLKLAFDADAEINLAKQRNGPTGAMRLFWQGKFTTFYDMHR